MAAVDSNGCNALQFACNAQRTEPIIGMTLQMIGLLPVVALNQTPLDGQLRGLTALHIVSGGRDIEDRRHLVIAALVNAKANIEARDLNGRTPLLVAAGAAYWKGAETLHESGADMKATKPGGRNFADEAKDANRALASWWSDISGVQPSGAPRERRSGIYKRGEVSDKRHARMVMGRDRRSKMHSFTEVRQEKFTPIHSTRGAVMLGEAETEAETGVGQSRQPSAARVMDR